MLTEEEIIQFHREAVVVDAHCDTVHLFRGIKGPYAFGEANDVGHVDLPRLLQGGVDLQFFALFTEAEYKPCGALGRALYLLEHFHREMGKVKEKVKLIRTRSDLENSLSGNQLGALLTLEGGEPLESGLEILQVFYRLGLRGAGLTWDQRNALADGVGVGKAAGGLTKQGRAIVREMNRLGMVVDAAHMAPRGFYDVLEISEAPVVVTHANIAGVHPHERNITDCQLRALRDHGGVLGLTFLPMFINGEREAGLDSLLDHYCYAAERFGPEILGIGADYDGITETVTGLENVSLLPLLTKGLFARGFSMAEVSGILGGNFLRVLRAILKQEEVL